MITIAIWIIAVCEVIRAAQNVVNIRISRRNEAAYRRNVELVTKAYDKIDDIVGD